MATTPSVESLVNTAGNGIQSAANTAGSGIQSAANTAGSAIKSAANASVDWVKASVSDYTFTGYGVVSRGSSVKMFMGTDQQFFLGGKNAMTIGTSNTFTAGIKTDVMVGPAVSMGIAFSGWNATAGVGLQSGHLTAKYDFSTNKTFSFQIAEEGSSNYVTQSKFICEKGFQAVGGFQKVGHGIYSAYKATIASMGKVVAVTNFLMSIQQIAQTLESPELKKGETLTGARALWAQILPGVVAGTSAGVITGAAIYAAIQRETKFKTKIHPQSVIDLKKTSVFLGALGDTTVATQLGGASLLLKGGKATLGARKVTPLLQAPYAKDFDNFDAPPTAALEIDATTIKSAADHMISIAAGAQQGFDPIKKTVDTAQKTLEELQKKADEAAGKIYAGLMIGPFFNDAQEAAQGLVATASKDAVLAAAQPGILAAQAALEAAKAFYTTNPSLFLSAGGAAAVSLSKIEATSPNFNVISPSISLATNSPKTPATRGLFVTTVPKPSIELVQSPVSKISMDATGSIALTANPSVSLKLKPDSIVIQLGANTLTISAMATTMKSGSTKIECSMGMVKVGSALKIMGA